MKKLIRGAVVATAAAALLTIGAANSPVHAAENSWDTAYNKCTQGAPKSYVVGGVEKKSFKGGPKIGTLYVVHMRTDEAHRTRYCAVTIKGGKTAGKHHDMFGEIINDDLDVDSGDGYRKAVLGPFYVGGDFVVARAKIQLGDIRKTVSISG